MSERIDKDGWRYGNEGRDLNSDAWPEGAVRWRPLPGGGTEKEIYKRGAWRNPLHGAV